MVPQDYGFLSESASPIRENTSTHTNFQEWGFFIDPQRCIGCRSCVGACAECGTHRGRSMIHLDEMDRFDSPQTVPTVCMHCEDPICARVCPADAIKQTDDGVTMSSLKPRCIGCSTSTSCGCPKSAHACSRATRRGGRA